MASPGASFSTTASANLKLQTLEQHVVGHIADMLRGEDGDRIGDAAADNRVSVQSIQDHDLPMEGRRQVYDSDGEV